jgi:putative membrane protein
MANDLLTNALAATLFAVLGIVIFIAAFVVVDRMTPGSLWKEIIEEHNTALAILSGAMAIALAIIIAAAVH